MRLRVAKKVCRNRWHRPYRDSTWRTAYRRQRRWDLRHAKHQIWMAR